MEEVLVWGKRDWNNMIKITESKMNNFHYKEWISYFKANHKKRLDIDFSKEKGLSASEMALIFPSIRAFRKGEGSEGRHLLETARVWARKKGEPDYEEAMLWFVREENWHSSYLKKFMDYYNVEDLNSSFLYQAFCSLRRFGGLKCEVITLVTAEMIALTYYDALFNCTDSPALKSICQQMLHDELPHIMFQSHTLSLMGNHIIDRFARILVMEVTLLFVWCAFHKVYQAGGYGFGRFWKENLGYLQQSAALSACLRKIYKTA